MFEKILLDEKYLKKSKSICEKISSRTQTHPKTLSRITILNVEAVGLCSKPEIEPVLVMTLVLSHKLTDNRT